MIILLQFRSVFDIFCKVRQSSFITKCDRLLLQRDQVLQTVTDFYHKMIQVL